MHGNENCAHALVSGQSNWRSCADHRSYDLPDDVFEKGETKPTKPVKAKKEDRKKKKTNGAKNAKRPLPDTGFEVRTMRATKKPRLTTPP